MSKQNRAPHLSPLPAGIVELSVHRPPHITHA
ncbi:MAG: sulfurtransferase FdhD, partial [Enterobacter asburiae]|nr:sulfurtransferase FdhD [Enterobacter asburiae]